MSNPLALGAVTAVLRTLIEDSIGRHDLGSALGGTPTVSAEPPDRIETGAHTPDRINLFLFQATENPGWRNTGLPSRNAAGERLANSKLALDLHYLVTAYGAADLHAEVLLGHAMFVLHETPVLTRDAIRGALAKPPPSSLKGALAASKLAGQLEQIKIVPQVMSVEETSKIWSALQSQYRPTAAYQVTVVLIEAEQSTKPGLPVRSRNLQVLPFHQPVIEQLLSQSADGQPIVADAPILAGHNLVIAGQRLRGDVTRVLVGGQEVTPSADKITDTQITLPVPPGLHPGVQPVQVVHRIHFQTTSPSEPHRGFESNGEAFVLHPTISAVPSGIAPTMENSLPVIVDGVTLLSATVTVTFTPLIGKAQRVTLLLYEFQAPATRAPRAYTFPAPVNNGIAGAATETATIAFAVRRMTPGKYLVCAQVDGAESVLDVGPSGEFATPQIAIT